MRDFIEKTKEIEGGKVRMINAPVAAQRGGFALTGGNLSRHHLLHASWPDFLSPFSSFSLVYLQLSFQMAFLFEAG